MTPLSAHEFIGAYFDDGNSGDGNWTVVPGAVYLGIVVGFGIYFISLQNRIL